MTSRSFVELIGSRRSTRWVLPAFMVLVAGGLAIAAAVGERRALERQSSDEAAALAAAVRAHVEPRLQALIRMARRWEVRAGTPREEWNHDARLYVDHDPAFQAIEWVDPGGRVRWIVPLEGNEAAAGLDLSRDEARNRTLVEARATGRLSFSEPVELVQGGRGILAVVPIGGQQEQFDGFILGVLHLEPLLSLLQDEVGAARYGLALGDEQGRLLAGSDPEEAGGRPFSAEAPLGLPGLDWTLQSWPTEEVVSDALTPLPWVVLAAGLLGAMLLWLSIDLMIRAREEAMRLNATRAALEREVQTRIASEHELRKSNRELESFAHVASHDLQEPLRMVASFSQLILDKYGGVLDERGQRYAQFAVDGAHRMQSLLRGLLAYSRVHSKGETFSRVDLGETARAVVANLRRSISEAGAKVEIGTLPVVHADQTQMVQLLQNLVANAIKFRSPEGAAPRVRIESERTDDRLIIRVRDNGIGIEDQYCDRIFQIFERLHGHEAYAGTGVGLAVCRRIVERHGGRIWAESQPGAGSTFSIEFPATIVEGSPSTASESSVAETQREDRTGTTFARSA